MRLPHLTVKKKYNDIAGGVGHSFGWVNVLESVVDALY